LIGEIAKGGACAKAGKALKFRPNKGRNSAQQGFKGREMQKIHSNLQG
jgi:hypothetical protein